MNAPLAFFLAGFAALGAHLATGNGWWILGGLAGLLGGLITRW